MALSAGWLVVATLASSVPFVSASAALAMGLFFLAFAVVRSARDAHDRVVLLLLVAALACATAVWGLLEVSVGLTPSGPFVNKNNFAAFLICGVFLTAGASQALFAERRPRTTAVVVFTLASVCFYLVAMVGSRGAWVGAASALAVLLTFATVDARRLAIVVIAAAVVGTGAAQVSVPTGENAVATRLASIATPVESATTRTVIWKTAAPLVLDRPLTGYGPGTFFLHWGAVRDPEDSSAGWHAHNDYLQFAVETGIPGVVFFLLLLGALVHAAWRARTAHPFTAWAIAGITAIAVHSLVTFNFQLGPLLFLTGLAAGWIATQARPVSGTSAPAVSRILRVPAIVVVGALSIYAVTSAVGHHHFRQAVAADDRGDLRVAYAAAGDAIAWWPSADVPRQLRATLLFKSISGDGTELPEAVQAAAVERVLADLAAARRANPFRADPVAATAVVLLHAEAVGLRTESRTDAERLFREALDMLPRHFGAVIALAELLEEDGRDAEALAVLTDGIAHWSLPTDARSRMIQMARDLATKIGDAAVLDRIPEA